MKDKYGNEHSPENGQFVSQGGGSAHNDGIKDNDSKERIRNGLNKLHNATREKLSNLITDYNSAIKAAKQTLNDDEDFNASDKRKYSDIKTIHTIFDKPNEELKKELTQNDIWLGAVGTEPAILKNTLEEIGYLKKPKVVNEKEYIQLKNSGAKVLYRGVKIKNYQQSLRDDESCFIGRGARIHGIYFATDSEKANGFAGDSGSVAEVIMNPKSHIVTIDELSNIDNENRMDIITGNITDEFKNFNPENVQAYFEHKNGRARKAIEAAMLGYDAIDMMNGDMVILNRGSLIMKGDDNE